LGKFFQANQSFWENPKYGNLWIRHPTNQPSSAKSLESCDDLPSVARCKMCHLDREFAHPEIVSRLISNQQFWTEALAWHGHFSKKKHPGGSGVPGIHDFPSENRVNMNISQHHDYINPTKDRGEYVQDVLEDIYLPISRFLTFHLFWVAVELLPLSCCSEPRTCVG
jgi:hypothetical protein